MRVRRAQERWSTGRGAGLLLAAFLAIVAMPEPAAAVPSGCGGPACVNIGGLSGDAFDLGTWNGSANQLRVTLRHCVFSNRPNVGTKVYDATVTGVGTTGGAFTLAGPGGNLPYGVEINDNSGFVAMTTGTPSTFNALSEANFDSCTDSATSAGGQRLRVTVLETDMETFDAGVYSGTLRIDVETTVGGATDNETSGTISVEIPPLVRLLNLKNNFAFGTWDPDGGGGLENFDSDVCVWSNDASDEYTVTVTTDTGAFEVVQGPESVAFEVWWSGTSGISTVGGSEAQLAYNTPEAFTTTATTTNCTGGGTASMVVAIDENAAADAPAGAYATNMLVSIGLVP